MTEDSTAPIPAVDPVSPISAPTPAPPVKPARSRLQLPLLSMGVVVAVIAIAATHRFWWPSATTVLANVADKQIPGAALIQQIEPAAAPQPEEAAPVQPPPVTQAAPSPDLQELRGAIDDLRQRPTADPQASAALAEAVRRLDDRITGIEARLDRKENDIRAERALTLAAAEIEQALANSSPYDAPIAVIRSVVGDDPALAVPLDTLAKSAKTGLPSRWALNQKLDDLAVRIAQPVPDDEKNNFWDRTLSKIGSLVTIRRERDAAHPDAPLSPEALIATAQRALIAGDLDAAIQQIQQLPAPEAERATPWLALASARQAAEQAAMTLQTALTQRLAAAGKGP